MDADVAQAARALIRHIEIVVPSSARPMSGLWALADNLRAALDEWEASK